MRIPEDPYSSVAIIDDIILKDIVHDITTGALLLESDDETLDMMLTQIWEMRDQLHMLGVIIGEA
tara:strand:+ start:138 stop:332 length:195 start_codon:yes stop_codon:yes gene_type:complete